MQPVNDLDALLARMEPQLYPGRYAFITLPAGVAMGPDAVIACMREPEGITVVLAEQEALALGLPIAFVAAWITLAVQSELSAVGLTAAFSTALAQAGISCNVMAGVHHDHLFVPAEQAHAAMDVLRALQQSAAA